LDENKTDQGRQIIKVSRTKIADGREKIRSRHSISLLVGATQSTYYILVRFCYCCYLLSIYLVYRAVVVKSCRHIVRNPTNDDVFQFF
jgi:hypothetical protein